MTDLLQFRFFVLFLLGLVLFQALFALFPGLDLQVSGQFFDANGPFPAKLGAVPVLNDLIRTCSEMLSAVIVIGFLVAAIGRRLPQADLRCFAYLAANLVLAPGLIVNALFKSHVGRARPDQILEFGGAAQFTPAWQVTDQCARNCSFTSGDVALVATLALTALVLAWPRLTRLQRALWGTGGGLLVVGVGLMRIALGRHFLSDVVFSILVSVGVALALYPLLGIGTARRGLEPLDLAGLRGRLEAAGVRIATAQAMLWRRA